MTTATTALKFKEKVSKHRTKIKEMKIIREMIRDLKVRSGRPSL